MLIRLKIKECKNAQRYECSAYIALISILIYLYLSLLMQHKLMIRLK